MKKIITPVSIVVLSVLNFGCSNIQHNEAIKEKQIIMQGNPYCEILSDRAIPIKNNYQDISTFNIGDYLNHVYNIKNMNKIKDLSKDFNGTDEQFKSNIYNTCLNEKWVSQEYRTLYKARPTTE